MWLSQRATPLTNTNSPWPGVVQWITDSDWTATDFVNLTTAHFDYFLELKPEVLLFGTGAKQQFARPELYRELIKARIGIEFMDTSAACRTYNILVAENRKVVAAVLI